MAASTEVVGGPRRSSGGRSEAARSESRLALRLLIPTGIFLAVIVGYPVARALWLSLFSDKLGEEGHFVGLQQYAKAITGTGSGDFWAAFKVTVFFTVISVALEVAIGMGMALIMHRALRGRGLIRTSILVPWAIPTAATALLWAWMLQPNGIINALTGKQIIWTGSPTPAKFAIIFADTWKTAPFIALLLLAGLQIIPTDVYEAAKVDGANAWQRFTRITLPLIRGALVVAILFRMLDVLRIFDLPFILTQGANGTSTLSVYAYQSAIQQTKFGYGSALSILTFVFIFIVALAFIRLLGANVVSNTQREVRK